MMFFVCLSSRDAQGKNLHSTCCDMINSSLFSHCISQCAQQSVQVSQCLKHVSRASHPETGGTGGGWGGEGETHSLGTFEE